MPVLSVVYSLGADAEPVPLQEIVARFEEFKEFFTDPDQITYCWIQVGEEGKVLYEAQPLDFSRFLRAVVSYVPGLPPGSAIWIHGLESAFAIERGASTIAFSFCAGTRQDFLRQFIESELVDCYQLTPAGLRALWAHSPPQYRVELPLGDWFRTIREWGRLLLALAEKREQAYGSIASQEDQSVRQALDAFSLAFARYEPELRSLA